MGAFASAKEIVGRSAGQGTPSRSSAGDDVSAGAALSPARAVLADHLRQLDAARSAAAAARVPWQKLQPEIENAKRRLASAESAAAAIDDLEASDVASWARSGDVEKPSPRTSERTAAELFLEAAQRSLATTERAIADLRPAMAAADGALATLSAQTFDHVLAVLREEHAPLIERLKRAREDMIQAEADAAGVGQWLSGTARDIRDRGAPTEAYVGYAKAAAPFIDAFREVPGRELNKADVDRATVRWRDLAARLAVDASAQLEEG